MRFVKLTTLAALALVCLSGATCEARDVLWSYTQAYVLPSVLPYVQGYLQPIVEGLVQ